jgi:hypothetical protein
MSKRTRLSVETLDDRCLPSFSPAVSYPVGTSPMAVVTADFNNDGQPDVATSNYDGATGDGTVSVLLGNADGSFQPARTSATGSYPISLTAGDFNADGRHDLAMAIWYNSGDNDVSILLGRGDGTFADPAFLNTSEWVAYAWSIETGDLNADGTLDLVVTSDDDFLGGYVEVLLGHGDGNFAAAATYGPYIGQILSSALADLSGDGNVDVAVTDWHSSSVKVLLGNGDGTLREPSDFTTGFGTNSVAAGDFNADGKLDLATTIYNSSSVSTLLGNGDGTFQTARSFAAGNGPQSATASDVNGDGKSDLVVINPGSWTSGDGAVSVLLSNGPDSLAPPVTTATGGYSPSVVMADFNGDGHPDAAAITGSNNVSVLLNDGDWPDQTTPRISIGDVTRSEGKKGKTTLFTFTVTLSAAYDQPVTMSFATANGTATTSTSDYLARSGTLTFAPGETTKTITIEVKGDRKRESNEYFYLDLFGLSGNALFATNRGLGTILNDD